MTFRYKFWHVGSDAKFVEGTEGTLQVLAAEIQRSSAAVKVACWPELSADSHFVKITDGQFACNN